MRALAAMLAALFLAGCFYSTKALFGDNDAVIPIRDGAIYELRSPEKDAPPQRVRFTRVGNSYEMSYIGASKAPPWRVTFASIIQTHDDDYIAQISVGAASGGFFYWFLWPLGDDRYLIVEQSERFDEAGKQTFDRCAELIAGCEFDSAEQLREHYLDLLHPILSSGRRLATYTEMIPVEAAAAPVESTRR
jgi:hypothetical protein